MIYQDTSREAWERILPVAAELDRQIMGALSRSIALGCQGLTCQRVEGIIGRDHQAVSGNLRHLVERGLVEPSGSFGTTRSGRRAIIWRLTTKARGAIAA